MNKFCLSVIGILLLICCWAADNVVVDNIRYTLQKDNTLRCAAANKDALVDVVIPDNVRLNGIDYYVGSVERDGFRKCKNLKSIDLPNTIKISWSDVVIEPVYGVMDGNIAVLSCKFLLNGKEYTSARSYAEDDFTPMALDIAPLSAVKEYEQLAQSEGTKTAAKQFVPDVVDLDIPQTDAVSNRTFAVIIGNENYQRVANVDFAANDAKVFARYCGRTLGIPETNIRTYYDATYGDIVAAMRDIKDIASAYDGKIKVMLYYAGHGVPDESNRNAYILPVDASGTDMDACYPLNKLYDELGSLNAEFVVAFIDACFSGSLRSDGMLASARGIRLRPRDLQVTGNLVVLSAASGEQSALPYDEKGHGIFTYYLLDKLNSTRGDVNIGELSDYITTELARQSVVVNRKLQTPTVKHSPALVNDWRTMKIK